MNSVGNNSGTNYFEDNRKFRGRIKAIITALTAATVGAVLVFAINHGANFSTKAPEKELETTKVVAENTDKEFEERVNGDASNQDSATSEEKEDKNIFETIKDVFSKDNDNEQTNNETQTTNEDQTETSVENEPSTSDTTVSQTSQINPITGSVGGYVASSKVGTVTGINGDVTFNTEKTSTTIGADISKAFSHNPSSTEGLYNVSGTVGNTWYLDKDGRRIDLGVEAGVNINNKGQYAGATGKTGVAYTTPINDNDTLTISGSVGYNASTGVNGSLMANVKFGGRNNDRQKTYESTLDNPTFRLVERSNTPDNPNPDTPSTDKPNINTPTNPQEPVR